VLVVMLITQEGFQKNDREKRRTRKYDFCAHQHPALEK